MKSIDASDEGIFHISWSPDNEWVSYVRNSNEVCIANPSSGEIRVIGPGACPGLTSDKTVIIERDDEIHSIGSSGEKVLVAKKDLVKESPKRNPVVSPDGKWVLFAVNNVFDKESQTKNAYPYRHFMGIGSTSGGKMSLTDDQWYGGTCAWFPQSDYFTHFEFDSTGGARIHVLDLKGKSLGTMFGLYPSVCPDGTRIACKPRSGGTVVVYTRKESWDKEGVETTVHRIPDSQGRLSGSSPQWLDNRYLLVDDSEKMWRLDTRKEDATEMTKLPKPVTRGTNTMALSPSRELLAMEVAANSGYELVVASIA